MAEMLMDELAAMLNMFLSADEFWEFLIRFLERDLVFILVIYDAFSSS